MRFQKIDAATVADHSLLTSSDICFFLHEYTSGQGFGFGAANNLISNLKKPVGRHGRPEYVHKERAIAHCGQILGQAINADWLRVAVIAHLPCVRRALQNAG